MRVKTLSVGGAILSDGGLPAWLSVYRTLECLERRAQALVALGQIFTASARMPRPPDQPD
jgi:hypothetical protein